MGKNWNRVIGRECHHPHTVVVSSVGVRRTVCESCGHISFKMAPNRPRTRRESRRPDFKRAAGL